ncbi:MAG TPA: YHS domain-containing protein [Nitrososphaerales archaeon]|nr:YHS domain-containing protein [Nitrososphaerales archaeon]
MMKDPVCGMMVDEKKGALKSEYKGKTYYFCSASCKKSFDMDPGRYAGSPV